MPYSDWHWFLIIFETPYTVTRQFRNLNLHFSKNETYKRSERVFKPNFRIRGSILFPLHVPVCTVNPLVLLDPASRSSGSNVGPETGYSDRSFRGLSPSLQENAGIAPEVGAGSLSFTSFPFHYSLIITLFSDHHIIHRSSHPTLAVESDDK
jgi:hypothetical protein